MQVFLAPAALAASPNPVAVTDALARGWTQTRPTDVLHRLPLSDGELGFLDAVHAAVGGLWRELQVTHPDGGAVILRALQTQQAGRRTGYLASQELLGLSANLLQGNSFGIGQAIEQLLCSGLDRLVLVAGQAHTHDGGAGMLAALGLSPELATGGTGLAGLNEHDFQGLAALRQQLEPVELILATATETPLTGFSGVSATCAQNRGATPEQAQALERSLGQYADLAQRALGPGRPLLGRGLAAHPGSGAGGGLGFAALLLGAQRVDAVAYLLELTGCAKALAASDLVVTAQPELSWGLGARSLAPALAQLAAQQAIPTVVIADELTLGRRELLSHGISAAYQIAECASAGQSPIAALSQQAGRVARTWSRAA